MASNLYKLVFLILCVIFLAPVQLAKEYPVKKVLIVTEGNTDLRNFAIGDGRQLANLMGHFRTTTVVKGVNQYNLGELNNYDFIFFIGFTRTYVVPQKFMNDFVKTSKEVIWINTGITDASKRYDFKKLFGFSVSGLDSLTGYDYVKVGKQTFTKGEQNTHVIEITDRKNVKVLATAYAGKKRKETPYIVKSKNFMYISDSPFASASSTDRYIYFSDMLHDILGEDHETEHSAILRIEDITPMDNPDKLREIADVLSDRGIPFLVGVVPFYVNPAEGTRISLSDKPDLVDALKYMVKNGATIVMHGVTHQYKGITAADFEFWDESTNGPIKDETEAGIAKKIELGLQEFMRNGLYPMLWETPHYTASFKLYNTISKYFSTAIEQRLSVENFDYSQFFPYVINKDLFGQKIYPENLGYVPLDNNIEVSRAAVHDIIVGARANLAVRDGFAACFFHEFLDINLLKTLVDSVRALGYEYIDLKETSNWVHSKDRVILTGSQDYSVTLEDQYLYEAYFDKTGEVRDKVISDKRLKGKVSRTVKLNPGEFYKAEPVEFKERQLTLWEKLKLKANTVVENVFKSDDDWQEAKVGILWNYYAKGAGFNDQASFISAFKSVNIAVDTIFIGQPLRLQRYNLIIVPFACVDSLRDTEISMISQYVKNGGNVITDSKNDVATELGIQFSESKLRVNHIRDLYFPEEPINWRYTELVTKFESESADKVFCTDDNTEMPMVIGRKLGKGKFIFITSRFDPYSHMGYSNYPFLLEYVRKFFNLRPIFRRNNVEAFFDPGFRHTFSAEQLVKQWVIQGIRIIHVAGWHKYPKYTYDYDRLIKLAHANGILVYAWLEPPQVSQKFWLDHPEWREKNWKGQDVRPSWRYPVAMTDKNCIAAMMKEYSELLHNFDFDGVNVAEVYFEAAKGFDTPDMYTPMHPSAQKEILKRYGIDINKIFNAESEYYWKNNSYVKQTLTSYRIDKLNEVYEALFTVINGIRNERPGYHVIVTAMDSYGSPELKEYIGVDMDHIIGLQKKYNFTLNVEDPENLWSTDPLRYIEIGKKYAALLGGNNQLMLDLNILKFRKPEQVTPFPTLIQTGTECFELINASVVNVSRALIYAESSMNPQDMIFVPYALANKVQYTQIPNGYDVNSPYCFSLKLPKGVTELTVDGKLLAPSRDNQFIIPAGHHTILFSAVGVNTFSAHELQTKLLSITGNLQSIDYGMRSINMEYTSDTRMLVSINREPTKVFIDGKEIPFTSMKGNDCYSVFLPVGHHSAYIIAGDEFSYGINLTSLWSTTAIAIFGSMAVLSLIAMFISIRIKRIKA
ncbi:MAG: DUF2334 domain-containing protein [Ignavibacteria bacterium]|nr:DUF2334 domain-containing protein [Ignavibacteria bacterium]